MKTGTFEKWLWQLVDGTLSARRKSKLEKALNESTALSQKQGEIIRLQTLLANDESRFSPGFASRTMERIRQQQGSLSLHTEVLPDFQKAFNRVFITGVAAAALLIIGFYLTSGNLSVESLIGLDQFSDENLISYLLYEF